MEASAIQPRFDRRYWIKWAPPRTKQDPNPRIPFLQNSDSVHGYIFGYQPIRFKHLAKNSEGHKLRDVIISIKGLL